MNTTLNLCGHTSEEYLVFGDISYRQGFMSDIPAVNIHFKYPLGLFYGAEDAEDSIDSPGN